MDSNFFLHFLRNPKFVGAVAPLSQSVAKRLVKYFNLRKAGEAWRVLEVGAGTGSVTSTIIEQLGPNDLLDVIEIDASCVELLKEKFGSDKRVQVHGLSILDWNPDYKYDLIISTLPMNSFSPSMVKEILEHYQAMSSKEGICTYVEYMGLAKLNRFFSGSKNRRISKNRMSVLSDFHKDHLIEKSSVLTNFLPCNVYHLRMHSAP